MTTAQSRIAIPNSYRLNDATWQQATSRPHRHNGIARPYLTTAITLATDLLAVLIAIVASSWLVVHLLNTDARILVGDTAIPWLLSHIAVLGLLLLSYFAAGLYPPVGLTWSQEFRQIMMSTTLTLGAVSMSALFITGFAGSMLWLLWAWLLTSLMVGLGRVGMRLLCGYQDWWGLPVVVMGPTAKARKTVRNLQDMPWLGLRPACVLDIETQDPTHNDTDEAVTSHTAIDVSMRPTAAHYGVLLTAEYDRDLNHVRGVPMARTLTQPPVGGDIVVNTVHYLSIDIPGLPAQLLGPKLIDRCFIKRLLDVSLAAVLSVVVLPLIVVLAVLVKLDSTGPVFYGHARIGRNKNRFKAWKFRSMVSNADEVLHRYLDEHPDLRQEWEQTQKIKEDPRITRVGRFLRKTSLDELPQIWNVLCGQMSLVGPRPIVEDEVPRYGDNFDQFISVKPGITGLWQISGRNNTTYEERVALDIHYVKHWSPWMDLGILLKTIPVVIMGQGAY